MAEVAGISHRLQKGLIVGYGFTAIIVAWLAKLNPWACPGRGLSAGGSAGRRRPDSDHDGTCPRRWRWSCRAPSCSSCWAATSSPNTGCVVAAAIEQAIATACRVRQRLTTFMDTQHDQRHARSRILAVAIRAGTSLVYATVGEIFTERSGVLNLGLEGMMLMGAVTGFAVAFHTGNAWAGVARRHDRRRAAGVDPRLPHRHPARRPGGSGPGPDHLRHRPGQLSGPAPGPERRAPRGSDRPALQRLPIPA